MKKPELKDFDITPDQYALCMETKDLNSYVESRVGQFGCISVILIALPTALAVGLIADDTGFGFVAGILALAAGGAVIYPVMTVFLRFIIRSRWNRARSCLLKGDVGHRLYAYETAMKTYEVEEQERRLAEEAKEREHRQAEKAERERRRKLVDHWMSLGGREFEWELATLYRYLGYDVEATPATGDQGIDLVLRKDGKTTIVQCKSHQKPVGPAVVRELFGSMVAFRADNAILACTGGFTQGVKDFVRGKPITLISATELARMGSSVEGVGQNPAEFTIRKQGMMPLDGDQDADIASKFS